MSDQLSTPSDSFAGAVESNEREERMQKELAGLEELKLASSIFDFEVGSNAMEFCVTFHGKGLTGKRSKNGEPEIEDIHQIAVRCGSQFPQQPPQIRWRTPFAHPNVSLSGIFDLADIGVIWRPEMSLEIICEKLWDMTRLALIDWERSINHVSRNFLRDECCLALPVDARILRNRSAVRPQNLVHYRRKFDLAPAHSPSSSSTVKTTVYIGDTSKPEVVDAEIAFQPPSAKSQRTFPPNGIEFIN
jgi:ubiquitin-protein ligase